MMRSPLKPQNRQTGAKPQTVLILANPTSGSFRPKLLEGIRNRLAEAGCNAVIRLTRRAGEIGETCADSKLAVNVLVVAGGDGSINEALTGFQTNPAAPDLAIIPFGTANVLARELKLPFGAEAIANMILQHQVAPLHLGLANGRPFVLMASAGFDAEVVHGMSLDLKRRLGKFAYVLTAVKNAVSRKSRPIRIIADGIRLDGKLVIATNGKCYGGAFVICPEASVVTPGLHLLVFEKDDFLSVLRFGLALAFGRVHMARGVKVIPFREAEITGTQTVAVQIDGEPFASTPLRLEQSSDTYSILVP